MSEVLDLASRVKYPAFVGYAFAAASDVNETETMIDTSLHGNPEPGWFAIALSAGADYKFKAEWRSRIADRWSGAKWSALQVGRLILDWSDESATWVFVESLGQEVEQVYWSQKVARPVKEEEAALEFMAAKYLAYGRALAALEAVSYSGSLLSANTLFRVLDASISEINATPSAVSSNLAYEVEQIFNTLRAKASVPGIEIAKREYAYLPLLGFRQTHLTIHSLLVQDPDFFISLLCDVFKPASGEAREPTEERRARAAAGYRVLSECHTVPGLKDGNIDQAELNRWTARVRELAATQDRSAIADEYIGHIVAYAPVEFV